MTKKQQMLHDVMERSLKLAFGIKYWAEIKNLRRDADLNVVFFQVRDYEEMDDSKWVDITPEAIEKAMKKIINGKVEISEDKKNRVTLAFREKDSSHIDVETSDYIVQIVNYKKVAWG